MSNKKPEPMFSSSKNNICPVCGKASYSAGGIHPQCAVKQADDKRRVELKKIESEKAATTKKADGQKQTTRWQKTCPKCSASLHVRKKTCDCGHTFS